MHPVWPSTAPTAEHHRSFADAAVRPLWWDTAGVGRAQAPLDGAVEADLCIIGGGFTGLWAAVHAAREQPGRDVMVLESDAVGFGASGRNGGFLESSLTHGLENGLQRFAGEMDVIERLAWENLDGLRADVASLGIDCDLREAGSLWVALTPREVGWLEEGAELYRRWGYDVTLLDAAATRAELASPTFLGAGLTHRGSLLVEPGKLAVGLRDAAVRLGVRVFEGSPVTAIGPDGAALRLDTPGGPVRARRVLLATGAYPAPVRTVGRYIVPVYDYALATEPLTEAQWASVGWRNGQGVSDSGNLFHYYRPTPDGRILWGGYDAVYRFRGPVAPRLDDDEPTFAMLAQHFFTTFPQLEGLRFSHRWGGPIDTCSRFSAFFGTAHGGRLAYVAGYTGLGVGATRFGARVALDLLDGRNTEATRLKLVRRRPLPFPPEPLRWAVVQYTRRALEAADHADGRRGLWLRTLDRLGLGFDS